MNQAIAVVTATAAGVLAGITAVTFAAAHTATLATAAVVVVAVGGAHLAGVAAMRLAQR